MLRAAMRLAREGALELVLLHVVNPLTDAAGVLAERRDTAVARVMAERQHYLDARLAETGATEIALELLRHGEDRPGAIARVCVERGADMLAVASNRASGVRGLILSGVTQQLLCLSPYPVLVVRAD